MKAEKNQRGLKVIHGKETLAEGEVALHKLKMTIAYDGLDFYGFQRQPGRRTVQGTLEETIQRITGEKIQIVGAGRTDAGVHAKGQVIHFLTENPMPLHRWQRALNLSLPRDLVVLKVEKVPLSFHARHDACWRHYRYTIDRRPIPDVFTRRFRTHLHCSLDVARMRKAGKYLEGTHDFTSFSVARSTVEDRVRTLYQVDVEGDSELITISLIGNGFLHHMVRIIVGTLVEVGSGQREPDEIPAILAAKDRRKAGKTFPPEGLCMMEVGYESWVR